jgi:cyclopropane fatty-acyl-phospholipid synthase-like methyltransferase
MENIQADYWELRFKKEGKIWGERPCGAAVEAARLFAEHRLQNILVPGCGYGRNARYFAQQGFNVGGFDISPWAVEAASKEAKSAALPIEYKVGDILNPPSWPKTFDGIFTFNLLHLFGQEHRSSIASWFYKTLGQKGVLVLTSMSLRDPDFGKGEEVGYHTFESKKGRPVFYFDQEDMRHLFQRGFQILRLEEIQEHEDHGGKEHFHWMWSLAAKKV